MIRKLDITIYEESVPSKSTTIAGIVMAVVTAAFLVALIEELFSPSARFAWAVIAVLFCLSLAVSIYQLINRKLKISISTETITLAFTYGTRSISFSEIKDHNVDKESTKAYRGQGMYTKTISGRRTLIYSSTKSPKIILDIKEGKYGRIAFSTTQPDRIARILSERVR